MIEFKTTVTNDKAIKFLFRNSPEQFRKSLIRWLIKERGQFVGDKKRDGSFTRTLLNKKTADGRSSWSRNVAKSFKGYIDGQQRIETLNLRMGLNLSGKSAFAQNLGRMETGYKQTGFDLMIIPNYENLPFRRPRKLAMAEFKAMYNAHKFDIINKGGRVYFFEREGYGRLLFWGTQTINVPQQFKFYDAWQRRVPGALQRGQKTIDEAVANLNRGVY
jgi:hypothetical protein